MKTRLIAAAALLLMTACGGGTNEGDQAEALTRAQKDSIVADMPIPGASGVGRAMEARDRANAKTALLDSLSGNRP